MSERQEGGKADSGFGKDVKEKGRKPQLVRILISKSHVI